jgi:hypothetical protein
MEQFKQALANGLALNAAADQLAADEQLSRVERRHSDRRSGVDRRAVTAPATASERLADAIIAANVALLGEWT